MLPLLLVVVWIIARIGTFFFIPILDDETRTTVNVPVPLWAIVLAMHAAFLIMACVFQFRNQLILATTTGLVGLLLLMELVVIPLVFGRIASLEHWLAWANTLRGESVMVRRVAASPVAYRYFIRRVPHQTMHARIQNWNCSFAPITHHVEFNAGLAGEKLCVDVHTGRFGWEWIENLRKCSDADLRKAANPVACPDSRKEAEGIH